MVSACLAGKKCRYDGNSKFNSKVMKFLVDKNYILFCPEQLGGLQVPHPPAEIFGGLGKDVIEGKASVINSEGDDVTKKFISGAEKSRRIAKKNSITTAILKEMSPSCGVSRIYRGDFSKNTINGSGVAAALLNSIGINLLSEDDLD